MTRLRAWVAAVRRSWREGWADVEVARRQAHDAREELRRVIRESGKSR